MRELIAWLGLSELTASGYAAWWGAVVATLALAWNILRALRAGPRIRVRATPNMMMVPGSPLTDGKLYISVTAVNRGDAPTTITHFCGYYAKGAWQLLRRQRQEFVVAAFPGLGDSVPHVLEPGAQWSNMADQASILESQSDGLLRIGILHNQRKRPVYARLRLRALKNAAG